MNVFKDKSWVKLRRMSNEYKECLDVFFDRAFATSSIDNKIACPWALCGKCFFHERKAMRGHLLMKAIDGDYQKGIWVLPGSKALTQ